MSDTLQQVSNFLDKQLSDFDKLSKLSVIPQKEYCKLSPQSFGYGLARIIYCAQGNAVISIEGEKRQVEESELLVIGQYRRYKLEEVGESCRLYEFVLSSPSVWYSYYNDSIQPEAKCALNYKDDYYGDAFIKFWEILTSDNCSLLEVKTVQPSLVTLIFAQMKHLASITPEEEEIIDPQKESRTLFFSILSYMAQNYHRPITRKELCQMFKLNINQFSELFLRWQRCSFKQVLIHLRLNRVRFLLISSDKSIAEISSECGFNSPDHFIYTFRTFF